MSNSSRLRLLPNILWSLLDRTGRMLIAFFTGIIVARQLAPELYGMLSFANALVGVLSFLNFAAIEAIVVLALVREPEQKEEILGSALLLRLLGATLTVAAVVAVLPFLEEQPPIVAVIAPIVATATIFTSMEVGEYWLRQVLASKYGVIARQSALLLGATGRIWASGSDSPLLQLALITVLEALLVAVCLAIALQRLDAAPWQWRAVRGRCRQLIISALPLLLAAAAVGLYARLGVIMLGHWQHIKTVGLFSIATIMAEATHALPIAIMSIITPTLLRHRLAAEGIFNYHFIDWLRRLTWLGIFVCLLIFFSAPVVIPMLFGGLYDDSVDILRTLIWSALFVHISAISEIWLISNNLQHLLLKKTLISGVASIVLNAVLIPKLGATGAAIASLASYSITALWANAIFKESRPLFKLQIVALIPFSPKTSPPSA